MGIESILTKVAAPVIGGLLGSKGSKQSGTETSTQQQKMDPRMEQMLFGGGGQTGLLSQYQGMLNDPRSAAATGFAGANADYLNNNGAGDLAATRNAAMQAMQGNQAPTMQAAQSGNANQASLDAYAVGNMVQAPAQNSMNLSGSYDSLINGAPGANPYLTGGIQKGINQSANAFGSMVTDAKAATQDVLGSIRGNSVLNGQFGGSRQGIAEGKAIDSMNTNLSRAAAQFGQNNTDAAVAAQAGAYNTDRDRQLSATQGLGAQQYGVASQDANTRNQAEFMNVGNLFDASKTNSGMAQQSNQFNAGLQQQAGLANQQAQLSTNAQNNGQLLSGAGLLSGLSNQASGQVNANDSWKLQQAQGVNSLLAPYMGANSSSTSTQPMYQNTAGSVIGGALGGLQLGNQLGGMFGGGGGSGATALQTNGSAANYQVAPTNLPVQSFGFGW